MVLQSTASESNGEISPDGRWLAYSSDESGRAEIYVRPFPNVNAGRQVVSTDGGTRPRWSSTGGELFYYVQPGMIMAVPVTLAADIAFGKPQLVVKGQYALSLSAARQYDVTADGQRFLLLKDASAPEVKTTAETEFHLVINWFEELKRLVPTGVGLLPAAGFAGETGREGGLASGGDSGSPDAAGSRVRGPRRWEGPPAGRRRTSSAATGSRTSSRTSCRSPHRPAGAGSRAACRTWRGLLRRRLAATCPSSTAAPTGCCTRRSSCTWDTGIVPVESPAFR